MDISVYTNALEERIQQMLSQMYSVSSYGKSVSCELILYPGNDAIIQFTVYRLLPRNGAPGLAWANETYKRLRIFPCTNNLHIKFDSPRASWNETSVREYYNVYTWDKLPDLGGLTAYTTARIPAPVEAHPSVTVKLNWNFNAQGGVED